MSETMSRSAALLTVDLRALAVNYREIERLAAPAQVAAVVKADAYGLGLVPVARALHSLGCRAFFVATLEEGALLRDTLPGGRRMREGVIFVLNGYAGAPAADFQAEGLTPVLNSLEDVEIARSEAARVGHTLAVALHVDTGMNRLGLRPNEMLHMQSDPSALSGIMPALLMSHLACADTPEHPLNEQQRMIVQRLRIRLPTVPVSLANSAGCLLGRPFLYDVVRPGIALYGGNPRARGANPFQPVVTFEAPILQVRRVDKGETVGYAAVYRAERPTRVATLAAGYADGYMRALGEGGQGMVAGHSVPVIGRISMDLITVDVSDVPEALTIPGTLVELIGPNVVVDEAAATAGTISYELLTRLGPRSRRRYIPATPDAPAEERDA